MEKNRAGLMMCEIDIGKEVSEVEGRLYQVPHIIGIFGWALVVHDMTLMDSVTRRFIFPRNIQRVALS